MPPHSTAGIYDIPAAKLLTMTRSELSSLLGGDPAQAGSWVRAAAQRGLAAAQICLGRMLLDGWGMARDEAAALGWFMTAARSLDAEAMNMVGRCHENGWGTAPDPVAAVEWYRKSAAAGHDWAQYNLGHMLLDGNGVATDRGAAFFWYGKAAAQCHARAMNLVARCHEEGWGTPRDDAAAALWYRRSAEGGYFRGQYNWATILAGRGLPQEAATWFRKAAEGGTRDVRRAIAEFLMASDQAAFHALGLDILERSCADGAAVDFYRYGRVIALGIHRRPDIETGCAWLRRAAAEGHAAAGTLLAQLRSA